MMYLSLSLSLANSDSAAAVGPSVGLAQACPNKYCPMSGVVADQATRTGREGERRTE